MLDDIAIIDETKKAVKEKKYSAEYGFNKIMEDLILRMESIANEYLKERVYELKEFKNRVLSNILGNKKIDISQIDKEIIIVSELLSASDTAQIDPKKTKAFITDTGGATSHAAIVARQLGIPAVVGTVNITQILKDGDIVIVDGFMGTVIISPSDEEIKTYKERMEKISKEDKEIEIEGIKDNVLKTKDGYIIDLALNYNFETDHTYKPDSILRGVGLLRSEYLFFKQKKIVDFEEQKFNYEQIAEKFNPYHVIVRLLDIGGDKFLEKDIVIQNEENPFLGLRGVRLLFEYRDVFKEQIKAIMAANFKYGNLKMMIPMVSCISEIRQTKDIMREAQLELKREKIGYRNVEVGVMIETPSAALMSDVFASEVDFFSIGTNDLTQYVMAVDRNNSNVAYLFNYFHPAVLRLIKTTITNAHKNNIPVSVCGEMAGEPMAAVILIGMGVDELSMNRNNIRVVYRYMKKINFKDMKKWAAKILKMHTAEEALNMISKQMEF